MFLGFPREEARQRDKKIFKEIMDTIFSNVMKTINSDPRNLINSKPKKHEENYTRHIMIKQLSANTRKP